MITSLPSHDTSARNPSHFGSNESPPGVFAGSGMAGTALASIGAGIAYAMRSILARAPCLGEGVAPRRAIAASAAT